MLLGVIVNVGVLLSKTYRELRQMKNIQMSALSVMDQLTRNIKNADSIDGGGTAYGTANGSLLLRSVDSSSVTHTTKFYLSGGKVMVDKEGVLFGPLTDSRVTVSSLLFRQINTGNSLGVKIEMTIAGKKFYNTALLRESYY